MSEQYSANTDIRTRVTEIFKAIGDYNRTRIKVELLSASEASVGCISHQLNLSQSNVSHQLKLLKSVHLESKTTRLINDLFIR